MSIRPKNVAIDIDGVLADFNTPYAQMLSDLSSIPLEQFTFTEWYWYKKTGIDPKIVSAVWDSITDSTNPVMLRKFWGGLSPLPGALDLAEYLDNNRHYSPYFVTARHPNLYRVTYEWLRNILGIHYPQLIMSEHKGLICGGLDATHFIDDKYDNCLNVLRMRGTSTVVCVLDQPYNQPPNAHHYLRRLSSVCEFLELLKNDASGGCQVPQDQRRGGVEGAADVG